MKFNLLFIDDEKDIIDAYSKLVVKEESSEIDNLLDTLNGPKEVSNSDDYSFLSASQGELGVEIVKKQLEARDPVHVCFVDFRMPPGINGQETIKQIRAIDKNIEIVLVTAYSDVDLEEIVEDVGTPDKLLFLKKPFDNKEVKQLMLNLTKKYFDSQVKENFVGNVSHELKTPLASIVGFSQLMLEEELSEDMTLYAKTIYENSLLMKEQIDDLIAITKIKHNKEKLNLKNSDIKTFFSEIENIMKPIFMHSDLNFNISINDNFSFKYDNLKFKQCILNLITNARKFTEKGSVELNAYLEGGRAVIEIKDTGIGIPESKIKNIFDQFYRVEDKHHNSPGLGLGLSIVKKFIDLHEFEIKVESEEAKGSIFSIYINNIDEKECAA